MNEHEINEKVRGAFTRATPDLLDSIRSRCETKKGTVIYMKQPKQRKPLARRLAAVAAALALVLAGGGALGVYTSGHAVASTVSLDINPSIEITVNKNEKVLSVTPRNEEAVTVVGTMDFRGSSLEVAVNAIIGSMVRNGYLTELSNSILLTVDDRDTARGQALESRLAGEIDALLHTGSFDGAVLSQTITADSELETLAAQYGITAGKAQLIRRIVAQDPRYSAGELAGLTINELNLILTSDSLKASVAVNSSGNASDKAYVGREAAIYAACSHARVSIPDYAECELDWDHGCMVYEVEFTLDGVEYEYDINARTGELVSHSQHHESHHDNADTANAALSADQAKAAAFAHAGVDADSVRAVECELDRENGALYYEVEFRSGLYSYSYEIDAATGAVRSCDKDFLD